MWRLNPDNAALTIGPLSAKIDPAQPHLGVHDIAIAGKSWPDTQLLQVLLPSASRDQPAQVAEAYVRDNDLVICYAPLPPFTVQPQIYWRLRTNSDSNAVGIELILSVQTSLLYSEPETTVSCHFGPKSVGNVADILLPMDDSTGEFAGTIAAQSPDEKYVFLQIIHPSDFHSIRRDQGAKGSQRYHARIFQEHLEKGVIRRARVCGWLVPSADWRSSAKKLLEALRIEPLPLTV